MTNLATRLPTDALGIRDHIGASSGVGFQGSERTPLTSTVRTCQQLLKLKGGLHNFVDTNGIIPTTTPL